VDTKLGLRKEGDMAYVTMVCPCGASIYIVVCDPLSMEMVNDWMLNHYKHATAGHGAPEPADRIALANRYLKCVSGTGHLWSDEPEPHCLHCNKIL